MSLFRRFYCIEFDIPTLVISIKEPVPQMRQDKKWGQKRIAIEGERGPSLGDKLLPLHFVSLPHFQPEIQLITCMLNFAKRHNVSMRAVTTLYYKITKIVHAL